ncbi:MAG: glutamate--cysteine ligase [Halieaceae bacterium]|jgi:gamma-glutamyl:cysteine ligase YbdK (ATP-grasp superfamily)|nr:glutamate--cysteine ligase [Halieaceae bacterium]
MGLDIDRSDFTAQDSEAFAARLEENLDCLDQMLARPGFGEGPATMGSELEMYAVDSSGLPLYANEEILAQAGDPQLTLELNRYNLEYNLSPYPLAGAAFAATEQEILAKLRQVRSVAAGLGGRVVPIGILPTLRQSDFGPHCITPRRRYMVLVEQLIQRRGDGFRIDINGDDPLKLELSDITLEGANTSFQVHYRVAPAAYADTFNAIQLATPLALAVGANSPTLFGHRLWCETRVPLFKQSIDTRHMDRYGWNVPARVNFGQGWARRGAAELFREVVRIYPALMPICAGRSPADEIASGMTPSLAELRLHQGTVWLWNRPVYDSVEGGHLRIEMRALPAGPTALDMVANAAFLIGLAEGLRPHINDLLPGLPFARAEYNFYRAAQHGLEAKLLWPLRGRSDYRERGVSEIIASVLPLALAGLEGIGVAPEEARRYIGIIDQRLRRRQTGATWQRNKLALLRQAMPLQEALHALLELYMEHSESNLPVAEWPL